MAALADQPFQTKYGNRKQNDRIQPHDIPVIEGQKTAKTIERSEQDDVHTPLGLSADIRSLAEIETERGAAQGESQSSEKRNTFTQGGLRK